MSATIRKKRRTTKNGRRLRLSLPASTDFRLLLGVVVLLNIFGLLMVLSASAVSALEDYGSSWYQFSRQGVWLLFGVIALVVVSRFDYHNLAKFTKLFLAICVGLMVVVLIPGVGKNVNGASRWVGVGQLTIQPSELLKLTLIIFAAALLTERRHSMDDWRETVRPIVVVFAGFAVLLLLQPNLGTTIIIASILMIMMFVAGAPGKPLAVLAGAMVTGAIGLAFMEPYRVRRLMAFTDPWADPAGVGFQTIQSQIGLVNGGWFGVGLGEGRAKYGFLPEAHTDFIFSIITEELGFLGAAVVIALFMALILVGIRIALRTKDRFGMLLATGITAWIAVQGFVNLGAVVGVLPITGVPLPFVSAGGSSLVVTMASVGVLLNIARQES